MDIKELLAIAEDRDIRIKLNIPGWEGEYILVSQVISTPDKADDPWDVGVFYLEDNGSIWRHHRVIGNFENIEILDWIEGEFK